MPSSKKSPKKRYSCGSVIQERAKCLLEKLLDYGDKALRFDQGFKEEGIEVTLLNGKPNERGLAFNINRNLLANWIGIRTETETLTQQESKNVSDKIKQVVVCLNNFEIISFYEPSTSGIWKLILPHGDKNKLINKLPALVKGEKAIANPHQKSEQPDASLIEERYFRATSNFDSLEPLERKSRIQVLEEIASNQDFPRYHWKVMEFLADFVRRKAPRKEEGEEERSLNISPDIQAALTVIGQRDQNKDMGVLDLSNTDLRGADLTKANLQRAKLHGVNLQGTNLNEANLQGTELYVAQLQGAFLHKTQLQRARLNYANLQGAYLTEVYLQSADLTEVNLREADLTGANLQGAILQKADLYEADFHEAKLQGAYLYGATNLKLQQIQFTYGDSATVLPANVEKPAHWM